MKRERRERGMTAPSGRRRWPWILRWGSAVSGSLGAAALLVGPPVNVEAFVQGPSGPTGAPLRAVSAPTVPAGAVDVKTLGVKGDGVTDDTAALNRVGRADGRHIYFSPGTYRVTAPVVWSNLSGQRIVGKDAKIVADVQFVGVPGQENGLLTLRGAKNVTVEGLTFDGRGGQVPQRAGAPWVHAVVVHDSSDVTLRALQVRDPLTNGLVAIRSTRVRMDDNVISGMGAHGIWTFECRQQSFSGNVITGLGNRGPSDRGWRVGGIGLLATHGEDFTASNNRFSFISDTATKTEGVNRVVYRNNYVENFGKDGIKVMPHANHSTAVSDAVVEGNVVRYRRPWRPDGSGYIVLHSVQGARVSRNVIESAAPANEYYDEDAIRVNAFGGGPPSRNVVLEGNEVRNTRRGIRVMSDGVIVRDNVVGGTDAWARSGLIVSAHDVVVSGNKFDGPVVAVLLDGQTARTRIEKNSFANHSNSGVYADNGNDGVVVVGNTFGANVARKIVGRVSVCHSNVGAVCP